MASALDLVYQYRQLAGRCEPGGAGLSFDEIDQLGAIAALFGGVADGPDPADSLRSLRPSTVELVAVVRGRGAIDPVRVVSLSPVGAVCRAAPYLDPGERVELVVEAAAGLRSYRFGAEVAWLHDRDGDGFELGLRFVGVPVLVRHQPRRRRALARAA